MDNTLYIQKWQDLLSLLKSKKKIAIACSGGLDSRLLTYAVQESGVDYKVLHIKGVHIPQEEEEILSNFSSAINIRVESYKFDPLLLEKVRSNPIDRCYHCKKAIFTFLLEKSEGYILCDGTNTDDLKVYRPGLQAIKELNILSPFVEAGISKSDIRALAGKVELPFAEQPSQACLLTRFDYGIEPTKEELLWLDSSEKMIKDLTPQPFRLRCTSQNNWELHIQAAEDKMLEIRIQEKFKDIKISFVESLNGYFDKKKGLQK